MSARGMHWIFLYMCLQICIDTYINTYMHIKVHEHAHAHKLVHRTHTAAVARLDCFMGGVNFIVVLAYACICACIHTYVQEHAHIHTYSTCSGSCWSRLHHGRPQFLSLSLHLCQIQTAPHVLSPREIPIVEAVLLSDDTDSTRCVLRA